MPVCVLRAVGFSLAGTATAILRRPDAGHLYRAGVQGTAGKVADGATVIMELAATACCFVRLSRRLYRGENKGLKKPRAENVRPWVANRVLCTLL